MWPGHRRLPLHRYIHLSFFTIKTDTVYFLSMVERKANSQVHGKGTNIESLPAEVSC